MSNEVRLTHPKVQTRDEDWQAFFRSQVWKDIKLILEEDADYGVDQLVGGLVINDAALSWLRGKVAAFREIAAMDENIFYIIHGEDAERTQLDEPDNEEDYNREETE